MTKKTIEVALEQEGDQWRAVMVFSDQEPWASEWGTRALAESKASEMVEITKKTLDVKRVEYLVN